MKTAKAAGFDRGAADKIAGRDMDATPPPNYAGPKSDEYRRGYRKGYAETRLASEIVGASFGFSASASASTSTSTPSSPPPPPPPADAPYDSTKDGFQATLPEDKPDILRILPSTFSLFKKKPVIAVKTQASRFGAPAPAPSSAAPKPNAASQLATSPWAPVRDASDALAATIEDFERKAGGLQVLDGGGWQAKNNSFMVDFANLHAQIRKGGTAEESQELNKPELGTAGLARAKTAFIVLVNEWDGAKKAPWPEAGPPPAALKTMDLAIAAAAPPTAPTRMTPDTTMIERASTWGRKNWGYLAVGAVAAVGGSYAVWRFSHRPSV